MGANIEDKKSYAQLERSLLAVKKAFDALDMCSQNIHRRLQTALHSIYKQSFEPSKTEKNKTKDKVANFGEYNFLRHQPIINEDNRIGLSHRSFTELSDEVCLTVALQLDKQRNELENLMARLDLSEKIEALNSQDINTSRANHRRSQEIVSARAATPVRLGHTSSRISQVRAVHKRNKSVELPWITKSSDPRANLAYDAEEVPSLYVKMLSTPLKSVETITQCPLTHLLILGGSGKADQCQNRMIVTMDKVGMPELVRTVNAHTHQINGMLARDGLIFSYSKDAFVKVWRSEDLESVMTIKHEGSVLSTDYDPLSKRTLYVWKLWNCESLEH